MDSKSHPKRTLENEIRSDKKPRLVEEESAESRLSRHVAIGRPLLMAEFASEERMQRGSTQFRVFFGTPRSRREYSQPLAMEISGGHRVGKRCQRVRASALRAGLLLSTILEGNHVLLHNPENVKTLLKGVRATNGTHLWKLIPAGLRLQEDVAFAAGRT
jgi:hypothetical protein